jgi:hypothetical protein
MLRRVFRPERKEVTEKLEKIYNKKRHNVFSSPNIKWSSRATFAAFRSEYLKERDHLLDKHRYEDNFKMNLRGIMC